MIDTTYEDVFIAFFKERLGVEVLATVIMKFNNNGTLEYDKMVNDLVGGGSYSFVPKNLGLNLKNRAAPPAQPSIEEPPHLKLKSFPTHLRYAFFETNNTMSVILAANLVDTQVEALIYILQRFKQEIGWTTVDIVGYHPKFTLIEYN